MHVRNRTRQKKRSSNTIAVNLKIHIVDNHSFAYIHIIIITAKAEHSDVPRWRGPGGGLS